MAEKDISEGISEVLETSPIKYKIVPNTFDITVGVIVGACVVAATILVIKKRSNWFRKTSEGLASVEETETKSDEKNNKIIINTDVLEEE